MKVLRKPRLGRRTAPVVEDDTNVHAAAAIMTAEPEIVVQAPVVEHKMEVQQSHARIAYLRPRVNLKNDAALKAKYAAIESLEERCFTILVDLGMVEIHN